MPYSKHVYVLVFDGFDEHGISLALSALHSSENLQIITTGFSRRPVTSAAGLRVLPDIACDDIELERAALFILPAGELWTRAQRNNGFDTVTACAAEMLQDFDAAGVRIGAAGSAVMALARAGMLEGISHTADNPVALAAAVPGLAPSPFFVTTPAIHDENIITAASDAPLAFAREISAQLLHAAPSPARQQAA